MHRASIKVLAFAFSVFSAHYLLGGVFRSFSRKSRIRLETNAYGHTLIMISSCVAPVGGCLDLTTFSLICIFCHGGVASADLQDLICLQIGWHRLDGLVFEGGIPANFHVSLHITSFCDRLACDFDHLGSVKNTYGLPEISRFATRICN